MCIILRGSPSVAQIDLKLTILVQSLEHLGLKRMCQHTRQFCFLSLFEIRTHCATHPGLELMILLIQPPMQLELQV